MKTQFKIFIYYINNIITSNDISLAINKFYEENFIGIENKVKVAILFKIIDGYLKNISALQIIDINTLKDLKDVFNTFWLSKLYLYKDKKVESIVFTYKYLEYPLASNSCIFNYPRDFDMNITLLPENYEDLPNNRQIETWGDEFIILNSFTYIINREDNYSFIIIQLENEYFVTFLCEDEPLYYFHDIYDPSSLSNNTFIRTIGDIELYYFNGRCHIIN